MGHSVRCFLQAESWLDPVLRGRGFTLGLDTEMGSPVSSRRADRAPATGSSEELLHRSAGTVMQPSTMQGFLECGNCSPCCPAWSARITNCSSSCEGLDCVAMSSVYGISDQGMPLLPLILRVTMPWFSKKAKLDAKGVTLGSLSSTPRGG